MNGLCAHGPDADLWWHLGLFHSSWQLAGTHLIGLMKKDLVIWQVKSLAWKPLFCSSLTLPEITGVEATCIRIRTHPQQCSLHQHLPPAFPWHTGVWDRSILRPAKCLLGAASPPCPLPTCSASKQMSPSSHIVPACTQEGELGWGTGQLGPRPADPSHQIVSRKMHR